MHGPAQKLAAGREGYSVLPSGAGVSVKVLFVSAEVSPFAKVGGLADVAGSLPRALRQIGLDVRVAMPAYRMIAQDPRHQFETVVADLDVALNPVWSKPTYMSRIQHDVPTYLIGTDEWFTESDRSESIYLSGGDHYLWFSKAVLRCFEAYGWIPDVVHCHDWHTGFVPVLMRESLRDVWRQTASVFTIHNLAYQGEFGPEVLDKLNLPHSLYNMHQLETWGTVNFLKAACVYADMVNTVSPTYAQEIQTEEYGCKLHGLMAHLAHAGRLRGILNGIDPVEFDPSQDPRIPANYSANDPGGKKECRKALLKELGFKPSAGAPIMSVVSRLSHQKGMDLLLEAAPALFALPAQLVVLGTGDDLLALRFRRLQEQYPAHLRFIERFDVELAQRIYAGSDLFLMPSSFEPCGLGQLIALRYGTIPVVRRTGGLADTIFEGENGFVFETRSVSALVGAAERAHKAFTRAAVWREMVRQALRSDFGWSVSAREYERLYGAALELRRQPIAKK